MYKPFVHAAGLMVMLVAGPQAVGALVMTDSVPGAFVDISTTGVVLALGDEGVVEVWPELDLMQTLFAGGSGRVWISNNGALGFLPDGSFGAFYLNDALPSSALFGAGHHAPQALAAYWDDLDSDTGAVYYQTVGSPGARVFIVQWQDRPHYPGDAALDGDEVSFQVQIFESGSPGHAQFLYLDVDFLNPALDAGASATIGYQAGGIGNDAAWSFNQAGAVSAGVVLTLIDVACVFKGDGNDDCHIALDDFAAFQSCLDGVQTPLPDVCTCYDFDDNDRVDLADFAGFQAAFTGPTATLPGC